MFCNHFHLLILRCSMGYLFCHGSIMFKIMLLKLFLTNKQTSKEVNSFENLGQCPIISGI